MGHLSQNSASTAKKNSSVQTAEQTKQSFVRYCAITNQAFCLALSTHALVAMTRSWRGQITVRIDVFVVANALPQMPYNLLIKSAKTAEVCSLQLDQPQLQEVTGIACTVPRNAVLKVVASLKKKHALFAELFSIPVALTKRCFNKHAHTNAKRSSFRALMRTTIKKGSTSRKKPTINLF
jgi:hypothetical protein